MTQFLIVNLTSVYECVEEPTVLGISTEALRDAGFTNIEGLASKLENSLPSSRNGEDDEESDEKFLIPGCNVDGSFVEESDGPKEEQEEPGNFGLRWKVIPNIGAFTQQHWCVVVNAKFDE